MNNAVELEVRPRPLSTGLWTIFSWLRRDYKSDSSESLSSAGSDRTVASFAFLSPARYQTAKDPVILPPPGPPTDTYKKRVHDRNIRRQYDRDITLHRKYGLFKSGETACGYDAFSLPPARRSKCESGGRWDRERRATSECFQRRLAHVPGKRRAPLPPVSTISDAPPTSLTRRSTRKRPAPQPPPRTTELNKENEKQVENNITFTIQMNQEKQQIGNDLSTGCKSEKYSKKEAVKNRKVKSEKSFLKQIFDSKKRNSDIDIASVKLLPSISELDKQAAEIIETCKLKAKEQNNNTNNNIVLENLQFQNTKKDYMSDNWICVTCLRKYNSSINTCSYCLSKPELVSSKRDNDSSSPAFKALDSYTQTENKSLRSLSIDKNVAEEKEKLKEMLKEMKDSLPKRTKHDLNNQKDIKSGVVSSKPINSYPTETPTLRVGSAIQKENISSPSDTKPQTNIIMKSTLSEKINVTRNDTPATPVIILPTLNKNKQNAHLKNEAVENLVTNLLNITPATKVTQIETKEKFRDKKDLHTPLKISSLLNPGYVPKYEISSKPQVTNVSQNDFKKVKQKIDEEKSVNSKKTSENNLTKPILSDSSASPSTSQISRQSININIIENRPKIEIKKVTAGNSVVLQNDSRSAILKKDKEVGERLINSQNIVPSSSNRDQRMMKDTQNQHSRRRELIHQLEKSIANGDEHAAAQAAAKLAQLRLSCSVLSYTSQILSQPSTSTADMGIEKNISNKMPTNDNFLDKHERCELKESSAKEKLLQKQIVSKIILDPHKTKTDFSTPNSAPVIDKLQRNQNFQTNKQENLTDAKKEEPESYEMITIAVLVEDKEATRGPVHLLIKRQARMRDLRREAEASLGVAVNLQRWIVGRVLCVNDDAPVISLAGPNFNAPFYLCVVESEIRTDQNKKLKITEVLKNESETKTRNVYKELVELEQQPLVHNTENFECGVCLEEYTSGRGVVLRECVHIFCNDCLSDLIRHCEEPDIYCPAMGCRGTLQEREIRALVTEQDYERWLARGLAAAESGTRNAFHCRTRDCKGWALCEPGVRLFPCPVCKHVNCITCQAIHDQETCEQYISKLKKAATDINPDTSSNDDGTRNLLNSLIAKGEALECPECCAIITKKWGCDWVKCSACKTEICWVTRGRRWGPAGKGDVSGGCRCGIDGKRCHPSCGYCH